MDQNQCSSRQPAFKADSLPQFNDALEKIKTKTLAAEV